MNHKQMFGQIVASWYAARGAFCSASPAKHTLFLISYVFLLAGFTDAVIWWMMGPMNGYTWQYYGCYAVLSWSLWFFLGPKGLASEQTLIFESGRWFSLDLLPGGPSSAIAAHSLGRTFKGRGIVVWVSIYCAIYLNANGTFIGLMTALCSMILGTVFMTYASVMFRMWSARGYSAVTSAIVFNVIYLMSGAVFPPAAAGGAENFFRYNPFASAVSKPVEILVNQLMDLPIPEGVGLESIIYSFLWCMMSIFFCLVSEVVRRDVLH